MNIQLTKLFSPNLANPVDLNSYILRSPKEIRKALELVASHPFGRSIIERSGEHEKGLPRLRTEKINKLNSFATLATYDHKDHTINVNLYNSSKSSSGSLNHHIFGHLFKNEGTLASTIIHEFRHAAQNSKWNLKKNRETSPLNNFFSNQIIEADAFATQAIFDHLITSGDIEVFKPIDIEIYLLKYKNTFKEFLLNNPYQVDHLKKAEPFKAEFYFILNFLPLLQVPILINSISRSDWLMASFSSSVMILPYALNMFSEHTFNRNYQSPWANETVMKDLLRSITIEGLRKKDISVFSETEINEIITKFFDQYKSNDNNIVAERLDKVSDGLVKEMRIDLKPATLG